MCAVVARTGDAALSVSRSLLWHGICGERRKIGPVSVTFKELAIFLAPYGDVPPETEP